MTEQELQFSRAAFAVGGFTGLVCAAAITAMFATTQPRQIQDHDRFAIVRPGHRDEE